MLATKKQKKSSKPFDSHYREPNDTNIPRIVFAVVRFASKCPWGPLPVCIHWFEELDPAKQLAAYLANESFNFVWVERWLMDSKGHSMTQDVLSYYYKGM